MMPQPNQQGPPPNYMMPQPTNYWCFPNGMMQQQNELNGNGATFSTMQQQASAFHMQSMQSSQEGANAQQPTNNPPVQEGSEKFIDQLRQFPSNAEDRDFGSEIPE